MRIMQKVFKKELTASVAPKKRVILVGVVDSLDKAPEAYHYLCSHMPNNNSPFFITYSDVITVREAINKRIPLPSTLTSPYFFVLNNPYDNTLDFRDVLFQTGNKTTLTTFLQKG